MRGLPLCHTDTNPGWHPILLLLIRPSAFHDELVSHACQVPHRSKCRRRRQHIVHPATENSSQLLARIHALTIIVWHIVPRGICARAALVKCRDIHNAVLACWKEPVPRSGIVQFLERQRWPLVEVSRPP
eukprot:1925623-Prymnesium_polylepis.2